MKDSYSGEVSRDNFTGWIGNWLPDLLSYSGAAFGIAAKCTLGVRMLDTVSIDLPAEYLRQVAGHPEIGCPVLSHWLLARRPQYVEAAGASGAAGVLLRQFGLRNVLLHGYADAERAMTSYFALFNVREAVDSGCEAHAEYIAGRVHRAMLAWHDAPAATAIAMGTPMPTPMRERRDSALSLTPAEQCVLRWLREGKTNWEISRILNKSEWTVKTQVQQILRKLDAPSRHDVMAGYRPRAAGAGSIEQSG